MSPLFSQLAESGHQLFRQLVPSREDQIPFSWNYAPHAFMYQVPLLLLAYLARRRGTGILRQLLIPVVIIPGLQGTFKYYGTVPDFYALTWMRGIIFFHAIAMTLDFGLTPEGKLKVGETSLAPLGHSLSAANGSDPKPPSRIFSGLLDAFELTTRPRGIGWKDSVNTPIPPPLPYKSKSDFLKSRLFIFIRNTLVMDVCDILLRAFPNICNPTGGSMFYTHLPPIQRYFVSTIINLIFGLFGYLAITTTQVWMSAIGVGLLGQSPSDWPPLMDRPWLSTSLHEFWGRRWHQMMRRPLAILGGIPGEWIAGRVGMVLGVFIASGLFHEFSAYVLPGHLDHRVTLFFTLQAVGILAEDLYRKVTGQKAGGWLGRAWLALFVVGFGQLCVDVWLVRGIAGNSGYLPAHISPARKLVAPTAYPIAEKLLYPWY